MKKEATQYIVRRNGVAVFRGSNVDAKAEYNILEDRNKRGLLVPKTQVGLYRVEKGKEVRECFFEAKSLAEHSFEAVNNAIEAVNFLRDEEHKAQKRFLDRLESEDLTDLVIQSFRKLVEAKAASEVFWRLYNKIQYDPTVREIEHEPNSANNIPLRKLLIALFEEFIAKEEKHFLNSRPWSQDFASMVTNIAATYSTEGVRDALKEVGDILKHLQFPEGE